MNAEKELTRRFATLVQEGSFDALAETPWPAPETMLAEAFTGDLPSITARCGVLGFSFPVWRFLTQGERGASLVEYFGMTRLSRPNDLRDATLPDPARDEFGIGFSCTKDGHYIEYRRAYILAAHPQRGCLIIRNNSWFFGRDRLPWPAAISLKKQSNAAWQAITAADFKDFMPIDQAPDISAALLAIIENHDDQLHSWLLADGHPHLCAFLRAKITQGRGMPYLGWVKTGMPPWSPIDVQPLRESLVAQLVQAPQNFHRPGYRLTLLSGPGGDLPAF